MTTQAKQGVVTQNGQQMAGGGMRIREMYTNGPSEGAQEMTEAHHWSK